MNRKQLIEIDCDGVLLDIHRSINSYVTDLYPGFDANVHMSTWNLNELDLLDTRLKPRIYELFSDPTFIGHLPVYDGAVDALKRLHSHVDGRSKLCLHTNVYKGCEGARAAWIGKLIMDLGIDIDYVVSSERKKRVLHNSLIIIEDNVENLRNSNASIKFMVRGCVNRHATIEDLGRCEQAFIVESFIKAVDILTTSYYRAIPMETDRQFSHSSL